MSFTSAGNPSSAVSAESIWAGSVCRDVGWRWVAVWVDGSSRYSVDYMLFLCVFGELGRSYDNPFLNFTVLSVAWPYIRGSSVGFNTSRVTLTPVINIQHSVCCAFSHSDCISLEFPGAVLVRNTLDRVGCCCSH